MNDATIAETILHNGVSHDYVVVVGVDAYVVISIKGKL